MRETESENIRVNGAMVRNLLEYWLQNSVQHVALVTGLKHYLGPFETYAQEGFYLKLRLEEHPRLKLDNFTMLRKTEILQQQPATDYLGIHRSHTVVGQAVGNNEYGNNFGSLRKYMQRKGTPFIWPGSKHSGMAYLM
jgi:hypothetical protein